MLKCLNSPFTPQIKVNIQKKAYSFVEQIFPKYIIQQQTTNSRGIIIDLKLENMESTHTNIVSKMVIFPIPVVTPDLPGPSKACQL